MRQECGRYADDEIDDLSFGESGGGIEDFLQICELELAAFDVDDGGGGGHGLVVARSSWVVRLRPFVVRDPRCSGGFLFETAPSIVAPALERDGCFSLVCRIEALPTFT